MKKFLLLISLLSLAATTLNAAQEVSVVSESWEECTNKDGTGLYFDMARRIFEPAGYKVVCKIYPYSRAVKYVQDGFEDCVPGPYAGDYNDVVYPKYPIASDIITAFYLKQSGLKWLGDDSLRKGRFAWIRGYDYQKSFSVPMTFFEVNDIEHAIKFMASKRVDYFLSASVDMDNFFKEAERLKKKLPNKLSDYSAQMIGNKAMFLCFSRTAKGKKLASIWDSGMEQLIKSGELKVMFTKWHQEKYYDF